MKNYLIGFTALLLFSNCLILVLKDEQRVLVGNHEDWFASDAQVSFKPADGNKYGSVIFTFASEGWAQGGMNSEGLFFDGAFSPFMDIEFDDSLAVPQDYVWQEVLDYCASVEEALVLLQQYQLPELSEVQIMLADRSGTSVVIGVENHRLKLHWGNEAHQLLTNFNLSHPDLEESSCWRFNKADSLLEEGNSATVNNLLSILRLTHQNELTVYSNIYDLTNGTVYLYSNRKFDQPIIFDLQEELRNGERSYLIEEL